MAELFTDSNTELYDGFTVTVDNYRLTIHSDDNPMSPRENTNVCQLILFHNRYNLGDKHDYNADDYSGWDEMKKAIQKDYKPVLILPVYLYDHSSLHLKIGSFAGLLPQGHAEFDSGMVGFAIVTRDNLNECYGTRRAGKKMLDKLTKAIAGELEAYNQYLNGEVYGYRVDKITNCASCGHEELEEIDSCWGFYELVDILDSANANIS